MAPIVGGCAVMRNKYVIGVLYLPKRSGLFLSSPKGFTLREHVLRFIPSECLALDYRLEGQFVHVLDLVEDVLHLFRSGDELAFLTVQFILHDVAAFSLLRLDVRLKIDNGNLAILQIAQRGQVPLKPFLSVRRFVRDA